MTLIERLKAELRVQVALAPDLLRFSDHYMTLYNGASPDHPERGEYLLNAFEYYYRHANALEKRDWLMDILREHDTP